jgi:hypothetical protein
MAAPMRVSFSIDGGRIELAARPNGGSICHHLALDVMIGACPYRLDFAAGVRSGRSRRAGLTI